jgi:hypothetical protein
MINYYRQTGLDKTTGPKSKLGDKNILTYNMGSRTRYVHMFKYIDDAYIYTYTQDLVERSKRNIQYIYGVENKVAH